MDNFQSLLLLGLEDGELANTKGLPNSKEHTKTRNGGKDDESEREAGKAGASGLAWKKIGLIDCSRKNGGSKNIRKPH